MFLNKIQPTQLRNQRSHGSTEFHDQNLRQIGQGVLSIDTTSLFIYIVNPNYVESILRTVLNYPSNTIIHNTNLI